MAAPMAVPTGPAMTVPTAAPPTMRETLPVDTTAFVAVSAAAFFAQLWPYLRRVGRQRQLLGRALKGQAGEALRERLVHLLEDAPGAGEVLRQGTPLADALAALPREGQRKPGELSRHGP